MNENNGMKKTDMTMATCEVSESAIMSVLFLLGSLRLSKGTVGATRLFPCQLSVRST